MSNPNNSQHMNSSIKSTPKKFDFLSNLNITSVVLTLIVSILIGSVSYDYFNYKKHVILAENNINPLQCK